MISHKGSEF